MTVIDDKIPDLSEQCSSNTEKITDLTETIPKLSTQQRELAKRSEKITAEQDIFRKRQHEISKMVSALFQEVNDLDEKAQENDQNKVDLEKLILDFKAQ